MIAIKLGRTELSFPTTRATRAFISCYLMELLGVQVGERVGWHAELYLTVIASSCDTTRHVRFFLVMMRC